MKAQLADWIVRTRRDSGSGFKLDEDLSLGTWPEDWQDREPSIKISQLAGLQGGIASTAPHPLIHAEFLSPRNRWLIVSRGRGGAFGAAGTVQELLAPEGYGLAQAWGQSLAGLRSDGLLDMRTPNPPPSTQGNADDTAACLLAMGLSEVATVIGCSPERMAAAIGLTARMAPEALVRDFVWGTWIERRLPAARTISAEWPESLRSAWPKMYQMTLRGRHLIDPAAAPSSLCKGLSWALSEALAGRFVANDSDSTTFSAWLVELNDLVPWTNAEAEAALMHRDTKGLDWRLTQQPELARHLARSHPRDSISLARSLEHPEPLIRALDADAEARSMLVRAVIQEAQGDASPRYELSLTTANTTPSVILIAAYWLINNDWASTAEAQSRRNWARRLAEQSANSDALRGILRRAMPPDHFLIRDQFESGKIIRAVDEIRNTNNPLRELKTALNSVSISPKQFVALVLALDETQPASERTSILRDVHEVIGETDRKPVRWVRELVEDQELTKLSTDRLFTLVESLLTWLTQQGHSIPDALSGSVVALLFSAGRESATIPGWKPRLGLPRWAAIAVLTIAIFAVIAIIVTLVVWGVSCGN